MLNIQELKRRMKGMMVLVMTPFDKSDAVDYGGLKSNVAFLVDTLQGRDASLIVAGSAGEFYALSDEERRRAIQAVVEAAAGKLPVFAGTMKAGTRETVTMSQYAESAGADGVMVVAPYYNVPTEEGMYAHYATVAQSIDIALIVYNNAAVSSSWIRPELMGRLAEIGNVIAVKETSPATRQQTAMLRSIDTEKMAVICGFDEVMFACMSLLGSPGFVASPPANFAPLLYYELWVAAQRDDYTRMKAVLRALQPLTDFVGRMNAAHGPHTGAHALPYGGGNMLFSVTKEGMNLSGLCGGRVRLPLVDVNATEVQELKPIVAELEAFKGVG